MSNTLGVRLSAPCGLFAMGRVGLEGVEQPLQTGLIIVVLLALDDNFLSAVDELFTALLGKVLV